MYWTEQYREQHVHAFLVVYAIFHRAFWWAHKNLILAFTTQWRKWFFCSKLLGKCNALVYNKQCVCVFFFLRVKCSFVVLFGLLLYMTKGQGTNGQKHYIFQGKTANWISAESITEHVDFPGTKPWSNRYRLNFLELNAFIQHELPLWNKP